MFQLRLALASLIVSTVLGAAAETQRQAILDELLRVLPKSEPWESWLARTGELPPDFASLPTQPFLPDPLRFEDGHAVRSPGDWSRRRTELLRLFQHYVTGRMPATPGNTRVASSQRFIESSVTREELMLEFGPDHLARLHVEIIVPQGKGPFPVFITQDNHRRWALVAASRGYIGVVYAGADSRDDTGDWISVWPDHDWTKLTRRAWAASRCIDYLYTRSDVDRDRIALTGHSRNGKTSIIAAAFDERINAVISSSSGAGGACSFRFFSEEQFGEGIEMITRSFPDWLHPRLRFFVGREEKLPIDMPQLIACVAPRPFLFATALNDNVESVWAIEQSLDNARRAYQLLGASNAIELLYRDGPHATDAHDMERYVDWLDEKFERGPGARTSAPVFPRFADWARRNPERANAETFKPASSETMRVNRTNVLAAMRWMLGEEPSQAISTPTAYGSEGPHIAVMLGRNTVPSGLAKLAVNFGNYVAGDIYYPTNAESRGAKLPVLIWLHPISVSHGYVPGYKRGESPHLAFARAGFAVFAFDQIGSGNRIEEVRHFYDRYPHWSLLGKTVADTRAALDALRRIPLADTNQVWLAGYGAGSSAALHAAALDPRITGVVAVGGIEPLRPTAANEGRPRAAAFQRFYPLVPRLGTFAGREDHIPYDYREIAAVMAPRRVLLFQPGIDASVNAEWLGRQFDGLDHVRYTVLEDYDRFGPEVQKTVIAALREAAGVK